MDHFTDGVSQPEQNPQRRSWKRGAAIGAAAFVLGIAAGQGTAASGQDDAAAAAQTSAAALVTSNHELKKELADAQAIVAASPKTVTETATITETVTETAPAPQTQAAPAPTSQAAPPPTTQAAPPPTQTYAAVPNPGGGGGSAYYANCSEAKAAGAAPILAGQPGYRSALDRDNDGVACE